MISKILRSPTKRGSGILKAGIIIILVICLLNLATMLTTGTELTVTGIEAYRTSDYVQTITWTNSGDTVYVNATTAVGGSSTNWVYVNVTSTSDARGIWLNCSYNSSDAVNSYFHGSFSIGSATSNGTSTKTINATHLDVITIRDKPDNYPITLTVDDVLPSTTFSATGIKIEYDEKIFLNQTSSIMLTGNDADSGIEKIMYKLGNRSWKESTINPATISLTGAWGANYLMYYAVDNANNNENITTKKIVIYKDWTSGTKTVAVGTEETYINESILCENLVVNGRLNLINVTYFAATGSPTIDVNGAFNVTDYDGSPVTTDDRSHITGADVTDYYHFTVHKDATLLMAESLMNGCGDNNAVGERGLYLLSDDATLMNNTINGTYAAIEVENCSPHIEGNTLQNNRIVNTALGYGIMVTGNRSYPDMPLQIRRNIFKTGSERGVDIYEYGVSPHNGQSLVYSGYGSNLEKKLSYSYNLSSTNFPVVTFSEWSVVDEVNSNASLWITVDGHATYEPLFFSPGDGKWMKRSIDLRAYVGKNITLVFNYTTTGSPDDPGWYLDNVRFFNIDEVNTYNNDLEYPCCGTSEGGDDPNPLKEWFYSDDTYDNCDWEHGTPTAGPSEAANGSFCWGTDLDGDTNNDQLSFLLLDYEYVCAGGNLTFWHWYDTEADVGGQVQISIDHGATWSVLDPDAYPSSSVGALGNTPGYTGNSGGWVLAELDLDDYIGLDMMLKFVYGDDDATQKAGWYIDDISFTYSTSRSYIVALYGDEVSTFTDEWNVSGWKLRAEFAYEICDNTFNNMNSILTLADAGYGLVENNFFDLTDQPSVTSVDPIKLYRGGARILFNDMQDPNNVATTGLLVQQSDPLAASDIVTITGNTFNGMNKTGSKTMHLKKGCINAGYNDFINCFSGITLDDGVNSIIQYNDISVIGGYGLRFVRTVNVLAQYNDLQMSGLSGIKVADNCEVELRNNNVSYSGKLASPSDNYGIHIDTNRVIYMSGNVVRYSTGDGIHIEKDTNIRLTNMMSQFNNGSGLKMVDSCLPIVFQGNYSQNKEYGIFMKNVITTDQINDVEVYKNTLDGIYLEDCTITLHDCDVSFNGKNGIYVQGGQDVLIGNNNKINNNDENGIYVHGSTNIQLENHGVSAMIRNNHENGIYFFNCQGSVYKYISAWNAENGLLIRNNGTGPASSVASPLVTVLNSSLNYNVDYGLTTDYTGSKTGHQIFLMINNNEMSFNGLLDMDTGFDTWIQWDAGFTSSVRYSNRRFDGDITVLENQALTLANVDIRFIGEDNTISTEDITRLNIDKCTISTLADSFRFKVFSMFSLTNSTIDKADSIYISESSDAYIYGNRISNGANGIYIYKSNAFISECEIFDCEYNGIFVSECAPSIWYTEIYNCNVGLYAMNSGTDRITMSDCNLHDNNYGAKLFGADVDGISSTWVDNTILDMSLGTYSSRDSDAYLLDSQIDETKVNILDDNSRLETAWYLNIFVTDEALEPIFNATLTLKNENNNNVYYYTDEDGWARYIQRKEYNVHNDGVFESNERETDILAKALTDEYTSLEVIMNQSRTVGVVINLRPTNAIPLPYVNMSEDIPLYNVLNLNDYFQDNEKLTFSYVGKGNLNVTILTNGSINIIPAKDWSGHENITFTAKDMVGASVWMDLQVDVFPVNDVPYVEDISISPDIPISKQTISVNFKKYDIDGGTSAEILEFIFWYKNGVRQDAYNYQKSVSETFKGEEWHCEIIVSDGIEQSKSYLSDLIEIQNSEPTIGEVTISPTVAYTDTPLRSSVKEPFDVDDLSIEYLYQWEKKTLDGWMDIESAISSTLDPSKFVKNDEVRLAITPFDGIDTGDPVYSNPVKIKNTPPSIEGVGVSPVQPRRGTGFIQSYPVGAYDKDGDQLIYITKWYLKDWPVPLSTDDSLDSNVTVEMNARIYVYIEPFDGQDLGAAMNVSFILKERDLDNDGIPDSIDDDMDNDGFNNSWESHVGTDPEDRLDYPTGNAAIDTDGDGYPDGDHNNSQSWMDRDDDDDGYPDYNDTFPLTPTEWMDWDKDGIGDNADNDDDNDGFLDEYEKAMGTNPRDSRDFPTDDKEDAPDNFWTNFFLALIIILILILCGVGVLYVYKVFVITPEDEERDRYRRDEDEDFDKTGLLDYLKKGLGSITAGIESPEKASDVSKEFADLDLEEDLVECSNCQAMIPEDADICPECDAHFLGEDEEEPVVGEPPDEDEDEDDEEDDMFASMWEDEEEEEEKPKKKDKRKSKKKDSKKHGASKMHRSSKDKSSEKKGKKGKKKGSKKMGKSKKKKSSAFDDFDDDDDDGEWF